MKRQELGAARHEVKGMKERQEDDADVKPGYGEYVVDAAPGVGIVESFRHVPLVPQEQGLQDPAFDARLPLDDEGSQRPCHLVHPMSPPRSFPQQNEVIRLHHEGRLEDALVGKPPGLVRLAGNTVAARLAEPR